MQRVTTPASSSRTVYVVIGTALLAAACGSAGGELDASARPAAATVPTPGRTANGQPILPPAASSPAPAPPTAAPVPAATGEALDPGDVIFDPRADAGARPAPAAQPTPLTPPPAVNPSPPPANRTDDDDDDDDDDDEQEEDDDD